MEGAPGWGAGSLSLQADAKVTRRVGRPVDRRWPRARTRAIASEPWLVGAEFVVQHDDAAGGVVRDVRAHCLTLGGFPRRTQRRRIVEVGLEHAVIRRLALAGGDVEAVAVTAQAGKLRHQWQVRVLVVASEMVRVRRPGIENEEPVHAANCNCPPDSRCAFESCVRGELNQPRPVRPNHIRTRASACRGEARAIARRAPVALSLWTTDESQAWHKDFRLRTSRGAGP